MGRRLAVTLVAVIAVAGLAASPRGLVTQAVAGDPKIADTLFKSGKQALGKGDAAGAISYFKKAQEENPDLIEACWWRASAQEKAGDKAAAIASYREYLTLVDGKPASSKEEQRLKGLAEKSVAQLAAGETEFKKLEDGFVAALLTFAKDNFVRDPGVSRRAIDALLAVRPDHEEAQKLLEKLGGGAPADGDATKAAAKGPPSAAPGPFKSVREWSDLLADKTMGPSEVISYENGVMIIETKGGKKVMPMNPIDVGSSFAYEMEFHVLDTYERGWFTGLVFGAKEDMFLTAFASSTRLVILQNLGSGQNEVASLDTAPLDVTKWHRLGVLVKGPSVEMWFDGKRVLSWKDPAGAGLDGEIGFLQQRCRTERRVYRAGKVE